MVFGSEVIPGDILPLTKTDSSLKSQRKFKIDTLKL